MAFSYIFGPVRSGRLGRSLGLDLVGQRICSFDCLYCEVGRTRIATFERKPYVPAQAILAELEEWFGLGLPEPDHLTLGGQGEPCLNSDLRKILHGAGRVAPDIPRAILTNSTLLGHPEVAEALHSCEVVLPSMDTLVQEEFLRLNRPAVPVDVEQVALDMLAWKKQYRGLVYLEVLLVRGVNDSATNRDKLRLFCKELQPDRIDVVTMTRPGAYIDSREVDQATLASWREALEAFLPAGSGIDPGSVPSKSVDPNTASELVLNSLSRRPQTGEQLQWALGLSRELVAQTLENLQKENTISAIDSNGMTFYSPCRTD